MASLTAHLTSATGAHGRLRFHRDCPRCQAERLHGSLAADAIAPRRTQAALAAGALAFSGVAAPAAALGQSNQTPAGNKAAGEQDQAQEGTTVPGGEAPGLEADFDPGGEDALDQDTAPVPSGSGGGEADDGAGPPVETEPDHDPDARILLDPVPAAPAPVTPPLTPTTPAPGPTVAPAPMLEPPTEVQGPASADTPERSKRDNKTKRKAKPRAHERAPANTSPTPAAPTAPAPAAQPLPAPSSPSTPPETVAVSQSVAEGAVSGPAYTVRAGDSLWSIARRQLGAPASAGQLARLVNRLWQLNHEQIGTGDPEMLHVGTVLRLP